MCNRTSRSRILYSNSSKICTVVNGGQSKKGIVNCNYTGFLFKLLLLASMTYGYSAGSSGSGAGSSWG